MLNNTQQIFTIFFAIFWSVVANALPKWKAFHYTFFLRIPQTTFRLLLSFLILNVLPIIYFSCLLSKLPNFPENAINQSVFHGAIPAFAIFGFYRIWVCIIEFFPRLFYREKDNNQYPNESIEPTLKSLHFPTDPCALFKNALMNLFFGIIYIVIGFIFNLTI